MNYKEYCEYQKRVEEFFQQQGISNLSPVSENEFSTLPCDCCGTTLAGQRIEANGYNPKTKEIQTYDNICCDCIYYAE